MDLPQDIQNQIQQLKQNVQNNPSDHYSFFQLCTLYSSKLKDYPQAVFYCQKAIDLNPQEASYHYLISVIYFYCLKQYTFALPSLLKALSLGEKDGGVYHMLARCYKEQNNLSEAIKYALSSIDVDQGDEQESSLEIYIECLMEQGQFSLCIDVLQKNINQKKITNKTYNYLGLCYLKVGENDKAIEAYRLSTHYYPSAENFFSLGQTLSYVFNYDEAMVCYERALQLDPKNCEVYSMLAMTHFSKKNYQKSIEIYQKGLKENPPNKFEFYNGIAESYIELKNRENALHYLKLSLQSNPDQEDVYINLSAIYKSSGEYQKALEMLQHALKYNQNNINTYLSLVEIFSEIKLERNAIETLNKALALNPKDKVSLNNIGMAFEMVGNYDKAIEYLNKAISIDKTYAVAYNNLSYIYFEKKDYERCINSCRSAISINPSYANSYRIMGNCFSAMKQYDKALESFDKAIKYKPNYAVAYCNKGKLLKVVGRMQEALEEFNKAQEIIKKENTQETHTKNNKIIMETLDKDRVELLKQLEVLNSIEIPVNPILAQLEGGNGTNGHTGEMADFNNKKQKLLEKVFDQFGETDDGSGSSNRDSLVNNLAQEIQKLKSEVDNYKQQNNKLERSISDLQDNTVKKKEVSHAILHNNEQVLIEAEMKIIYSNSKLHSYFKTFCACFSQSFIAYMSIASGLIEAKKDSISGLIKGVGNKVPILGKILEIFGSVLEKIQTVRTNNKAKMISSIAPNLTTMERMVEYAARKITLNQDKTAEIMETTDKSHRIVKFFKRLKSKVIVDQYDTPEKMLAFKDSTVLIMACVTNQINGVLPEDVQAEFVNIICEKDSKKKFENVILLTRTSEMGMNSVGGGISAGSVQKDGCTVF